MVNPMKNADGDWRSRWVIDEDDDAAAQAVHSTGFAVSIFRLRDGAGRPRWASQPARHYQLVEGRLRHQLGDKVYAAFSAARCAEALKLWHELGYRDGEAHRVGPRPEPPPCEIISWRSQWTVRDDPPEGPHAVHSSGFAFHLVYGEGHPAGALGWHATLPLHLQTRAEMLRAEIGDEATQAFIGRLVEESQLLWAELGYSDASPYKQEAKR